MAAAVLPFDGTRQMLHVSGCRERPFVSMCAHEEVLTNMAKYCKIRSLVPAQKQNWLQLEMCPSNTNATMR